MAKSSKVKREIWLPGVVLVGAALGLAMIGCGGSASPSTSSTSPTSQVNSYVGTENPLSVYAGGVWNVLLDNVTDYFSYTNVDVGSATPSAYSPSGAFTATTDGILDLTLDGGATGSGGYAVSLPGEGLLLRAGNSTTNVIGAAVSNTCPTLASHATFNFIALGTTFSDDLTPHVAYGSLQVAPSSSATWTFSNLDMYTLGGGSLSPTPLPEGTCTPTPEGSVIVIPLPQTPPQGGQPPSVPTQPTQVIVGISPSGLLIVDQGQFQAFAASRQYSSPIQAPGPTGPLGLVGVAQPAAALNAADMVGKRYAGFESDPLSPLGTVAVAFGSTPGTGTAITGGGFPNDDATQQPATDTTLDLGSQSSQTPGLFTSVTLTRPDTYALCSTPATGAGTNAQGQHACVFHGIAVAGQVAGKYVIFANINDPSLVTIINSGSSTTPLAVMNLLLYQQ